MPLCAPLRGKLPAPCDEMSGYAGGNGESAATIQRDTQKRRM